MALLKTKRERAIALDSTFTMTAQVRRDLLRVSDRILEAMTKYEGYIEKALKSYQDYSPTPEYIQIKFWIYGDKDHKHLKYPQWYYEPDYKSNRNQRMEIAQLEKEMESEPNWVDVNDMLYSEEYRDNAIDEIVYSDSGAGKGLASGLATGLDICSAKHSNSCACSCSWLELRWSPKSSVSVGDIIAKRKRLMQQLSAKDADGIYEAFYRLKDIYALALEDMLDINSYKVDLNARIVNY